MEIGIFQDRSYNADQTCWVWGRPEISTLRLVKSTEGTRRACWMHADHENILRDKLHKYAICRRSRFQKMYPTFACSVIIMAFPSRFLCQAGPTPHQGGLRHWRHWDTDSIQFINISFFGHSVSFCDRFPLDLSIFDLFGVFGQLESAFASRRIWAFCNDWKMPGTCQSCPNSIRRSFEDHTKNKQLTMLAAPSEKRSCPCHVVMSKSIKSKLWCPPCPHRDSSFRSRAASRRGCLRVAFRRSRHGIGEEPTIEQTV